MKKLFLSTALLLIVATPILFLFGCGSRENVTHVDGFYVRHVLIGFSEQNLDDIHQGKSTRYELAKTLTAVNNYTGQERSFWGTGGLYEEMSNALGGLTGQKALEKFETFISSYNDDPGMVDRTSDYLIPLGSSSFIVEFDQMARRLFNDMSPMFAPENHIFNPKNSIGNVFLNFGEDINGEPIARHLNFVVSDFGIHIIIVSGLSTR